MRGEIRSAGIRIQVVDKIINEEIKCYQIKWKQDIKNAPIYHNTFQILTSNDMAHQQQSDVASSPFCTLWRICVPPGIA